MKGIFITYSQAFNEEVTGILNFFGQKGYTRWTEVGGHPSNTGTPHLGSHAWPDLNHALFVMVEDDSTADKILQALHHKDESAPSLGLRAFMWNIEKSC